MMRKALTLAFAATTLAGCAAWSEGTRPPEWQPRVDEISRSQIRLEMRVDEVTRNLLALREKLDAQESALKQAREDREPREEPMVPPLPVVKVEPLPKDPTPPGAVAPVDPAPDAREEARPAEASPEEPSKSAPGRTAPADLYRRAYSALRDGRFGQAILDFEEFHLAVGEMIHDRTDVVAVVAFAGQQQDSVAVAGELECPAGEEFADVLDDIRLVAAGGPGGFFPFAHLRYVDDWL